MEQNNLKNLLTSVGLNGIFQNFIDQRVSLQMINDLTEQQLLKLGVETLGDRVRLKQAARNIPSSMNEPRVPVNPTRTPSNILQERQILFSPYANARNKRKSRSKTSVPKQPWTAHFLCLADRFAKKVLLLLLLLYFTSVKLKKVPTSAEKVLLSKAGLGFKKIKLDLEDNEVTVKQKIMCSESDTDGGMAREFPKLEDSGGFEMMRCVANCRDLDLMACAMTARGLKSMIGGGQSKIYIRPIQRSLDTSPLIEETNTSVLKEMCKICNVSFLFSELRQHLRDCAAKNSDDEMLEYDPFDVTNNPNLSSTYYYGNSRSVPMPAAREVSNATTISQAIATTPISQAPATTPISQAPATTPITQATATTPIRQATATTPITQATATEVSTSTIPNTPATAIVVSDDTTPNTPATAIVVSDGNIPNTSTTATTQNNEVQIRTPSESISSEESDIFSKLVKELKEKNYYQNLILVLEHMQKTLIKGRPLEIKDVSEFHDGHTNLIMVDRSSLLETGLDEIASIEDKFITLEVQFYGELADDYGGPRKEFFLIMLRHIEQKYFKEIREDLVDDYYKFGVLFCLSILQNGKIPHFIGEEKLKEIFESVSPSSCMSQLRRAFQEFGIYQVVNAFPTFINIFIRNETNNITFKRIINLLKGSFSEEGSNERKYQNEVYKKFISYLREAASGRRGNINLGTILQFLTGTDEEPLLGFELNPSIKFMEPLSDKPYSFTPKANTCINRLLLPRPTYGIALPSVEVLFPLYDMAFANQYFGQR